MAEYDVDYLLLGHPAWPGNLTTHSEDRAQEWFDEHRAGPHPVYVVRRETTRYQLLTSEAACDRPHNGRSPNACPRCGWDPMDPAACQREIDRRAARESSNSEGSDR